MNFNVTEFRLFCNDLKIDSKEFGILSLGDNWSGTQEYFIKEVAKGLSEGIHYFIVLKGRQVMVSTICLALDLYWSYKFSGVQGTLITDTEENRDMFRETLAMYIDSLPNKWKQPLVRHNRTQLTFKNRSRFLYQVAGTKKKDKRSVGVGKAVMMMHATECSNWGDDGALADIEASLAQQNPKRLYIFESTARGPNGFQDMWEMAQRSSTQKAIFVGWWRNELYRCKKGSPEHNVYWDGRLTHDEAAWVDEVKSLYGFDIDDEQIAWWRCQLAEHQRDEQMMYQNYPPTENYAFVMSGSQFFNSAKLSDRMKAARAKTFDSYRFVFGGAFEDTQLVDSEAQNATLKIWSHPVRGAYYVVGADPAWGSSEWADRHNLQVFRCYADGMEQVAEFCTSDGVTEQFAWALLYLAGAYAGGSMNTLINLEINGPGMAVWQNIQTLKKLTFATAAMRPEIVSVLMNLQNHLYHRHDSLSNSYNYHTKTTTQEKERYMNIFRDGFESGEIVCHSQELMREMKNIVREDGNLGAPGRGKDDRVIGAGLATIAWKDHIQLRMAMLGLTRRRAAEAKDPNAPETPLGATVRHFLRARGLGLDREHPYAESR